MFVIVFENPLTHKVTDVWGPYSTEDAAWHVVFNDTPEGTIGNVYPLKPRI